MTNQVFLLRVPDKTTFLATVQSKSSLAPQRTGARRETSEADQHNPSSASASTRQGMASGTPDTTRSHRQGPAIQVAHPKLRAQQPSLAFFRQPASQKAQSERKLQWGRHREDIQELTITGGKGNSSMAVEKG